MFVVTILFMWKVLSEVQILPKVLSPLNGRLTIIFPLTKGKKWLSLIISSSFLAVFFTQFSSASESA